MTTTDPDYGPLIEFMQSRAPWFVMGTVPAMSGCKGTDVVLRVDGTYALGWAEPGYLARWLREVLAAAQIIDDTADPPEPPQVPVAAKPVVRCDECNRPLRAEVSRARGVGPVCRAWRNRRAQDYEIEETS